MKLPYTVWVLSDGTAGNLNPALGLAEALHARMPCLIVNKDLAVRSAFGLMPPQVLLRTHFVSLFALQRLYEQDVLHQSEPLPNIVIGNGRITVPVTAALKRHAVRNGQKLMAVQLQNPRVSPQLFDMVVAPLHDRMHGENVVHVTGSLSRITSQGLAAAAAAAPQSLRSLPAPRIAVLIGGKSRHYMMRFPTAERLTRDVEALRVGCNGSLMVTASRRTEPENLHFLKTTFAGNRNTFFWNGNEPNPYLSYLALADLAVVTEDSVNMISEAACAGLKVLIYPLEGKSEKIERFHADMIARGLAERFTRTPQLAPLPLFDETARVADMIVKRIQSGHY